MGFSASDVVPFTQARANLSELAEQAKGGISGDIDLTGNGNSIAAMLGSSIFDFLSAGSHEAVRSQLRTLLNYHCGVGTLRTRQMMIDLQSLTGDSTDNVPGVPGIGPKTAAQLLEEFGDLDMRARYIFRRHLRGVIHDNGRFEGKAEDFVAPVRPGRDPLCLFRLVSMGAAVIGELDEMVDRRGNPEVAVARLLATGQFRLAE